MNPRLLKPTASGFSPRSISGLALWLDASDSGSTYTTDAGPVVAVASPLDIAGCALWLDGADATSMFDATSGGSQVAAGGAVARWQDKSGNGRNFVQSTSTLRPLLTASGRNGRSVVTFDATDDYMISAATQNIPQPATWMFVYKVPSSIASGWSLVDSTTDRVHVYSAAGSTITQYTAGGFFTTEASGVTADQWRIGTYHFNGASSLGKRDGVQTATGTAGTNAITGSITLGSNNGGAAVLRSQMAEAILLTGASMADIARVEAYLAAKWSISGVHAPATAASDPVGYWADKSGNGRHLLQPTSTARPTRVSSYVNGRTALTFDGTDFLSVANSVALGNNTVIMVVREDASANYGGLISYYPPSGNDNNNADGWVADLQLTDNVISLSSGIFAVQWTGAFSLPLSVLTLRRQTDAGNRQIIRANGVTNAVNANASTGTAAGILIGGRFQSGAIDTLYRAKITLCEVLRWDRALTPAEYTRAETALARKWGITLAPQVANADAQNWIDRVYANGGSVTSSTAAAVNSLCDSLDAASLRDRFYRLNLFCGSNLNAALVPLYRGPSLGGAQYGNATDTNNAFVVTDYSETSGLGPQATSSTTKYLDTGFAASSLSATRSFGVFIPAPTYAGNNLYAYLGASGASGVNMIAMPIRDGGVVATDSTSGSYNVSGATYTLASGHYLNNTPSGAFSLRKTLRNGTVIGSGADAAATLGSQSIYVMANNLNGAVTQRSPNGIYGYHLGAEMTSTQAEYLRAAFNTFATAVGRPNV